MRIQEAIKSGRPFRRKGRTYWSTDKNLFPLIVDDIVDDILADDWEVKKEWEEVIVDGLECHKIGCFDIGLTKEILFRLTRGEVLKYKNQDNYKTKVWMKDECVNVSNEKIFNTYYPQRIILEKLLRAEGKWYRKVE